MIVAGVQPHCALHSTIRKSFHLPIHSKRAVIIVQVPRAAAPAPWLRFFLQQPMCLLRGPEELFRDAQFSVILHLVVQKVRSNPQQDCAHSDTKANPDEDFPVE